jgi:hypothetical protein
MRIAVLTFTYPKDAGKAVITKSLLPKEWDVIWCVESKDKDMPVPEGVKILVKDFPRGEHLNVKESIQGMQETYIEVAKDYDIVIKMDSDVSLYKPECFVQPIIDSGVDFCYVRRTPDECKEALCNGSCYAMSRNAILYLKGQDLSDIADYREGHEDLIFSHFFLIKCPFLLISQINKFKVDWCVLRYEGEDCIMGHYGYVSVKEMYLRTLSMLTKQGKKIEDEYISNYIDKLDNFLNAQK